MTTATQTTMPRICRFEQHQHAPTTSFIGQASATTFVGQRAFLIGPAVPLDELLAEGYTQFADEDLALAESNLPAATETLPD